MKVKGMDKELIDNFIQRIRSAMVLKRNDCYKRGLWHIRIIAPLCVSCSYGVIHIWMIPGEFSQPVPHNQNKNVAVYQMVYGAGSKRMSKDKHMSSRVQ